ncbi:MAG: DUF2064 domain-containing protein [Flavobacteriaceae bacterium]|nr:DUF2064 domain-containing protein [Flavobacteriaceae bacterium]
MIQQTAILIFANSASKEIENKPFLSFDAIAKLNSQTKAIVEKTKLPYFHFSENDQIGDCFGERFTNAIQAIFDKGFENVIAIGNDTPHLKANHITIANQELQSKSLVLGPSKDGGFYLMGLQKKHFIKSTFLNFPWQTAELQHSINKLISTNNLKVSYLSILRDIDSFDDVKSIISSFHKISSDLITALRKLIFKSTPFFSYFLPKETIFFFLPNFNKGSPNFCL